MANRVPKKDLIEAIERYNDDPEKQLELLKNIVISEAKNDGDKELFTLVASAIKKTQKTLKAKIDKIKGKYKGRIAAAQEKLNELKQEQQDQVGPLSDVVNELKRIDTEARSAIAVFATEQMKVLEAEHEDLEPHEKAMLPAAENQVTRVKGVAMSFRDHTVVEIQNIQKVPAKYLVKEAVKELVLQWIVSKTGLVVEDIAVQGNGLTVIKFQSSDLPEECKKITGVNESAIIAVGGCPGVNIKTEKRPVVKG